jgi:hypothetical protein
VRQQPVAAAPKYGNSLDLVPADAAFYSASLRLREQFDIITKSNAWAKLKNLPSVQMAWQLAQFGLNQPGGPGDHLRGGAYPCSARPGKTTQCPAWGDSSRGRIDHSGAAR